MARIIINGTMIRTPRGGLNLWHLAWLAGFKKLGHDVYFVERSSWENDCYNVAKRIMTNDCSYGIAVVNQLLSGHGLSENWCFIDHYGEYHGLSKNTINEVFDSADLYIDLEWGEWIDESAKTTKRVFVDGEPGWFQIKLQRDIDNGKALPQYHYYSTDGGLIGTSHCNVPVGDIKWNHHLPPVLLDEVKLMEINSDAAFTTIMNWQSNKPFEYNGKVYGQKNIEFEKFIGLPALVNETMEVAISGSETPRDRIIGNGWSLKNADEISISSDSYLDYIANSKGEFSVAKNSFVQTNCGWFGDRAGYYLGSGRPVVLQDTGFSRLLPCGKGLIAVQTKEEAAEAIQMISSDYAMHSKAARDIAFEFLHTDKVLSKFLKNLGM